ncbi:hypothetical protein J5N97_007478 [Dioscorea zingiberensis]|uniref:Wall-associated receptor kinase galacturonan-binding domain-containing protein n=1 Tax=Dioscorea zingiberensis TaxID=325984 RepID=A0A9D5DG57_9LILI|nr:hypothetical protein J5N97_007478 [Dioscorea zingiberensis]
MACPNNPLLFFILLISALVSAKGLCTPSCGDVNISYPFHLKGDPSYCGNSDPNYELTCNSRNQTILNLFSLDYKVTQISYYSDKCRMDVTDVTVPVNDTCRLPSHSLPASKLETDSFPYTPAFEWVSIVNCTKEINNSMYIPVPCLSRINHSFIYLVSPGFQSYQARNLVSSCSYLAMGPAGYYDGIPRLPALSARCSNDCRNGLLVLSISPTWGLIILDNLPIASFRSFTRKPLNANAVAFASLRDHHQELATPIAADSTFIHQLPPDFTPKDLLSILRRQKDPSSVLHLFNWTSKQENSIPSLSLYEEILQILGKAGSFDDMKLVLKEIQLSGYKINQGTFLIFIEIYSKFQLFDLAVDVVLELMQEFGVEPDCYSYNSLLNILVDENKLSLVESLYSSMTGRGVQPDVSTFNILIKALCKTHQIKPAISMTARSLPATSFARASFLSIFRPSVTTFDCRYGRH